MIHLFVMMCLLKSPHDCSEYEVLYDTYATEQECYAAVSQADIARFAAAHDEELSFAGRFSCRPQVTKRREDARH